MSRTRCMVYDGNDPKHHRGYSFFVLVKSLRYILISVKFF